MKNLVTERSANHVIIVVSMCVKLDDTRPTKLLMSYSK